MSYNHLSTEQRYEIGLLKRQGFSNAAIAESIGVHRSSIGRELARNGSEGRYGAATADRRAVERRGAASRRVRRFTADLQRLIEEKLRQEQWSPQQISDRMRLEGRETVSHEWIYLHIWRDKAAGGDLHTHLRQARKKRRKRYGSHDRRGLIPHRVSIDDRPPVVDQRSRIGDWEIDTVIGAHHSGALVTSVERRSRYLLMQPVASTSADLVTAALSGMMRPHRSKVLTITADNGREFTQHQRIAEQLGADVYFAHPYHSWERGTNENTNGLVRQYFPKGMDLAAVDHQQAQCVVEKLNHRPRKTLGWKSPYEFFFDQSLSYFPMPP
jgi:transposase, IS30 family